MIFSYYVRVPRRLLSVPNLRCGAPRGLGEGPFGCATVVGVIGRGEVCWESGMKIFIAVSKSFSPVAMVLKSLSYGSNESIG